MNFEISEILIKEHEDYVTAINQALSLYAVEEQLQYCIL